MSDDKQPDEKGLLMLGSLMSSDLERQLAFAKEAAEHADKLVDLLNKCLTVISYAHTWLFFPEQKLSDDVGNSVREITTALFNTKRPGLKESGDKLKELRDQYKEKRKLYRKLVDDIGMEQANEKAKETAKENEGVDDQTDKQTDKQKGEEDNRTPRKDSMVAQADGPANSAAPEKPVAGSKRLPSHRGSAKSAKFSRVKTADEAGPDKPGADKSGILFTSPIAYNPVGSWKHYVLQQDHVLVWVKDKDGLNVVVANRADLQDGEDGEISLMSITKWLPINTPFTGSSTDWGRRVFVPGKIPGTYMKVKKCGTGNGVVLTTEINVRRRDLQGCVHCEQIEIVDGVVMPVE